VKSRICRVFWRTAQTEAEARVKTTALALRVIADRIEHGEPVPFEPSDLFFAA